MHYKEGWVLITPSSKYELYENARRRWPSSFRIVHDRSNAVVVNTDPSEFDAYREIEESISPNDEWSQLSVWAFHQALAAKIKECYNEGRRLVLTRMVSFEMFEKQIESNLDDDSWKEEQDVYYDLPKNK